MCETCGCIESAAMEADRRVMTGLLARNDQVAAQTRARLDTRGIFAVNLMSAPGSGKTALLEATAARFGDVMSVIVGDLETENDARRLRAQGVPAEQICTGTGCHLDAEMVETALGRVDLAGIRLLMIENVGNLVCPACFDLGQHRNVALLSTPEGDDKPSKYPVLFRGADLVLLTKRDLGPYIPEFDPAKAIEMVRRLGNPAPVLQLSARTGEGLDDWFAWLETALRTQIPDVAAPEVS